MSKRQVVQVAPAVLAELGGEAELILIALCDDGSLWQRSSAERPEPHWRRVADVPQD